MLIYQRVIMVHTDSVIVVDIFHWILMWQFILVRSVASDMDSSMVFIKWLLLGILSGFGPMRIQWK
jgi:hypothetical protein